VSDRHSRREVIVAALLVAGAGAWARADTPSTLYTHGKPVPLVDTFGCTEPDMLNEGKLVTIVAFTDGPIDHQAAAADAEPCRALLHQMPRAFKTVVELKLKYDGSVYNIQTYDAAGTTSRSGDGTLKLAKNDGTRVEGSYVSRDASKKRSPDGVFYDLHFAVDVAKAR
jgi:hypothetical protein